MVYFRGLFIDVHIISIRHIFLRLTWIILGLSFFQTVGHLFWSQLAPCASYTWGQSATGSVSGSFYPFQLRWCSILHVWGLASLRTRDGAKWCHQEVYWESELWPMGKGEGKEPANKFFPFSPSWDTFPHLQPIHRHFNWVDFPRHQLKLITAHMTSRIRHQPVFASHPFSPHFLFPSLSLP